MLLSSFRKFRRKVVDSHLGSLSTRASGSSSNERIAWDGIVTDADSGGSGFGSMVQPARPLASTNTVHTAVRRRDVALLTSTPSNSLPYICGDYV